MTMTRAKLSLQSPVAPMHISVAIRLVCIAGEGQIPKCAQYLLAGRKKRFSFTLKPHSSHRSKLNLTITIQVDFKNNAREQV